jgi:hypothetical protein
MVRIIQNQHNFFYLEYGIDEYIDEEAAANSTFQVSTTLNDDNESEDRIPNSVANNQLESMDYDSEDDRSESSKSTLNEPSIRIVPGGGVPSMVYNRNIRLGQFGGQITSRMDWN